MKNGQNPSYVHTGFKIIKYYIFEDICKNFVHISKINLLGEPFRESGNK